MNKPPIVIVTRFNIRVHFKCAPKAGTNIPEKPWCDSSWMSERMRLFETYTLPSVARQSEDYEWLVLFHKDTPPEFRNRITQLNGKVPQMTPIYLDDEECDYHLRMVSDYIRKKYSTGRVITLRIDSDDIIHHDYLTRLLKETDKISSVPTIISFTDGFSFDEESKRIKWYHYEQNHFLAMITDASDEKNCILHFAHTTIKQRGIPILSIKEKNPVTWIEVVSRVNYINTFRSGPDGCCFPYRMKTEYPQLDLHYNPFTWVMLCLKNRTDVSGKRNNKAD